MKSFKLLSFKNVFFTLVLLLGASMFAQTGSKLLEDKGVFSFESKEIDYGTIEHNADGIRAFKFTNTGNAPIIISQVKGSCGCTVPTKPNGPIMPGESAEIGVKYATNRVGQFTKTVTVTSNASEPIITLKIKGNVLPEKEKAVGTIEQ
ncbi:MAG: DUF1573 domain-containing protein [Flavobacteriaceae bacterium]|nr:DUF1573 domain-containing protein [Flavobacteriaceae bacterium]